jgi:ribosomal protein L37E
MSNHKYCDQCGQSINNESKFCASCGFKIKNQFHVNDNVQEIKNTNHLKKEQKNKILTKEEKLEKENAENKVEMSRQVNEYDTLSITQSVRGKTVLFMGGTFIFSLILGAFGILVKPLDVIFEAIVYIPILFFIFYGHRWASIVLMVMWTLEKIYTLVLMSDYVKPSLGLFLSILGFWAYIISLSLKNIEIENLRIRNKEFLEEGDMFVYEKDLIKSKDSFCSKCNIHYPSENEICPHCNNGISKESNNFKIGDFKFIIGVIALVAIFLLIARFSFSDDKKISTETINTLSIFDKKNDETKEAVSASCEKYRDEFQISLDNKKIEGEKAGVYKNVSVVKEIFYSYKIKTCVAVVEIVNNYQYAPERRMYANDIIKKIDLFSTEAYPCNYQNSCSNPVYSKEKNNFYSKIGELGGTVLKEDIPTLSAIQKNNTVTVLKVLYGGIETFELNYQDNSVTRNDLPGFAYQKNYTQKFTDCVISDINNWHCGTDRNNSFGLKDGIYHWWITGTDYGVNFTVLK